MYHKRRTGEIVEELSLAKALGVAEAVTGDAVIIGADTIVAKEIEYLKTKRCRRCTSDACHASGEKHQVYTGVTLLQKKGMKRSSGRFMKEPMSL